MRPVRSILILICAVVCLGQRGLAQGLTGQDGFLLYDWQQARCAEWDIVDTPARAWRDDRGRVHLLAGAEASRASTGPELDKPLTRDCTVLLRGAENPDPAQRDDRLWIASVFTRDGKRVEALVHAEYHGHRHAGRCAAGAYMPCWRNAILAATSTDGGRSFTLEPAPVAMLPYAYDRHQTRRSGYFNPSNMFEWQGWIYAFVYAEAYGAQKRGVCLMRRPLEGEAADWRFWDGTGFSGRFADPYTTRIDSPAAHVCAPLPGLRSVLSSVVRRGGDFLAVTPMTATGADGHKTPGIWALHSTDLIHWSAPRLLLAAPLLWRRDCDAPAAVAYPALLDPDSPSRLFDQVDDDLWLSYVRIALDDTCQTEPRRDLVAHRIKWPLPPAARAKSP